MLVTGGGCEVEVGFEDATDETFELPWIGGARAEDGNGGGGGADTGGRGGAARVGAAGVVEIGIFGADLE